MSEGRRTALLVGALAPLTVLAALGLALVGDDAPSPFSKLAGGSVATARAGEQGKTPSAAERRRALEGVDSFSVRFADPPSAAIVFDVKTGEVLWRRNPLAVRPIASITKVMTALIVAARTEPGDKALITNAPLAYKGSGVGVFKRGTRVKINALMQGLLISSGNDAATALAVHVAGSTAGFARLMNARAKELGLTCSNFVSAHGYESANRSCAADLAVLTRLALRDPQIARIARLPSAAPSAPVSGGRLYLNTTNPLLRAGYPGTIGLKTGFTYHAGRCLIAVVRRGKRTIGVVLLDSPDPGAQARVLVEKAFRSG